MHCTIGCIMHSRCFSQMWVCGLFMGSGWTCRATAFVGTMMIYTVEILYAVAGIVVIVAALQIGIKMNYHEGDITKSMMMLFGGILFMIGASIVMPALFGYQDMNFVF